MPVMNSQDHSAPSRLRETQIGRRSLFWVPHTVRSEALLRNDEEEEETDDAMDIDGMEEDSPRVLYVPDYPRLPTHGLNAWSSSVTQMGDPFAHPSDEDGNVSVPQFGDMQRSEDNCPEPVVVRFRPLRRTEVAQSTDQPENRAVSASRSTWRAGHQRRRSYDEERNFDAFSRTLRRCFERGCDPTSIILNALSDKNMPAEEEFDVPQFTSLLRSGLEFKGVQKCLRQAWGNESSGSYEKWRVQVEINRYHMDQGIVCGTMAAYVRNNSDPVKTIWEGEIIDNKNHTFCTDKWSADRATDVGYWTKFAAFQNLNGCIYAKSWKSASLKDYPYIFMRWKEIDFLTKTEPNLLSIQGFYYICLCRQTGELTGYYYDPHCQPFQELALTPNLHGKAGFAFSQGSFL